MPIVPRNTISEPSGARLPEVGMAKPRIAEAMGAVAGALGGRASSIGRLASTTGSMIDALDRQYRQKSEIAGAKYRGEMAKWNGVGEVAGNLVQGAANGVKIASAIYERKSREQADNALTEYTDYMTRASNGFDEPSTGRRVPGTLEAPYSPGNEQDEPTGPSIATAKAVKEWMEREDGTYAKLSPAAKAEFDQRAARITQSVMDRAMRQEYDQMQAFRQANDKAAYDADRKHLAALGTDVTPAGNDAWMIDMMAARDGQVMPEIGRYQKDPSNMSLSKAEWLGDDVKKYADAAGTQVLETFTSDRVDALLLAARNEQDDARREAILSTAVATAGMEHSGKRILSEEAFQKAKLEADNVRIQAVQARAAAINAAVRDAESEFGHLYSGRKSDPAKLQQLLAVIPPEEAMALEKKVAEAQTADEIATFKGQLEIYESQRNTLQAPGNTARDQLARHMATMTSPVALAAAKNMLDKADRDWTGGTSASVRAAEAEIQARTAQTVGLRIENGGYLKPDGTWVAEPEADQIGALLQYGKTGMLKQEDYFKLKKAIADRRPGDAENMKTIFQTIGGEIGNEEVSGLFALDGNDVVYATTGIGAKKKPATEDDEDIGDLRFEWKDENGKNRKRVVDTRAALVRQVAQSALEYSRQLQANVPDAKGVRQPPMSVAEFVRKSLRPENPAYRDYTEATIRYNATRMRDVTSGMERWLKMQEAQAFDPNAQQE